MKIRKDFTNSFNVQKSLQDFYEKPILRVSFELVMSVVVVGIFAIFALRPTLITMANLLREIDDKRELNKDLQQKMAALSTAQNEWTAYQSEIEMLPQAFFQEPSLEEVLLYLEYLARQQSVLVTGMSAPQIAVRLADEPENAGLLTLTPYEANYQVMGTFPGVLSFLQQIEKQKPLMSVETMQMTMGDIDDALPMSANFRIRVYVQQTPEPGTPEKAKASSGKQAATSEENL